MFPRSQVALKLNRYFLDLHGFSIIENLQDAYDVLVFADAKIMDEPVVAIDITKLFLRYRPWMLSFMAGTADTFLSPFTLSGSSKLKVTQEKTDLLYDLATICKEAGTLPCAVVILTSKSENAIPYEFNASHQDVFMSYTNLIEGCDITNIVCTSREAKFLHKTHGFDINISGIELSKIGKINSTAKRIILGQDIYTQGEEHDVIFSRLRSALSYFTKCQAIHTVNTTNQQVKGA